jgi:hypothetical protein
MDFALAIYSFIAVFLFSILFFVFSLNHYKLVNGKKFSFLNQFPFELFILNRIKFTSVGELALLLMGVSTVIFFYGAFSFFSIMPIIIFVFVLLMMVTFGLLFFISTINVKVHLYLATLLLIYPIIINLSVLYYGIITPFDGAYHQLMMYGAGVLTFIQLIVVFNPKLKNWAQLEKHIQKDTSVYMRPRVFILPLSQWLSFANLLVLMVFIFLAIMI